MSDDVETRLLEAGELLLNGWGYNWYRTENLLRADDVLLRNHAEALLGEALASLRQAEAAFRRTRLPPPSREHPLPDATAMAELRDFQALLVELEALRTAVRGAAMPPDDKIWRRHRDEAALLHQLGRQDAGLAAAAASLRSEAAQFDAGSVGKDAPALAARLSQLRGLLAQRCATLGISV